MTQSVQGAGMHWAEQIGPHTARLFEKILAEKPHPEMGYRSCLGIIRLAEQYSAARMEAAADRALLTGACRYQSVKSILKNSLDQQPLSTSPSLPSPPAHDNIRGAEYFDHASPPHLTPPRRFFGFQSQRFPPQRAFQLPDAMILLGFRRGSAFLPRRCLRSLLRFILPAGRRNTSSKFTCRRLNS